MDAPHPPAGTQQAGGVVEHGQGRLGVLGDAAVEGRVGDDDVEALRRPVVQLGGPVRLHGHAVGLGRQQRRGDGGAAHVDGADPRGRVGAGQQGGQDARAAAQVEQLVAVDVGAQLGEQAGAVVHLVRGEDLAVRDDADAQLGVGALAGPAQAAPPRSRGAQGPALRDAEGGRDRVEVASEDVVHRVRHGLLAACRDDPHPRVGPGGDAFGVVVEGRQGLGQAQPHEVDAGQRRLVELLEQQLGGHCVRVATVIAPQAHPWCGPPRRLDEARCVDDEHVLGVLGRFGGDEALDGVHGGKFIRPAGPWAADGVPKLRCGRLSVRYPWVGSVGCVWGRGGARRGDAGGGRPLRGRPPPAGTVGRVPIRPGRSRAWRRRPW